MTSDAPALSIVISTYNRGDLLEDAIRSALAQVDAPPYEIVVVDNNSTDGTRALVDRLARESDGVVRYLFEGRQGVAWGRNTGVAAARAPLIAFTDDDVRAAPDWLAQIARAFAANPWADFVGGRVWPRWPGPVPEWLTPSLWAPLALADYGDTPLRVDIARPITLVAANCAFRRTTLERLGGFDPQFQHRPGAVSACEDHELQLRVLMAGGAGLYDPAIVIEAEVQPHRVQKRYYRRWHLDHGRAVARMLRRGQIFDPMMVPTTPPPGKRLLLGAPPFAYRAVLESGARSVLARLRGRDPEAFAHECRARDALGLLVGIVTGGTRPSAPPTPR